MPKEKSSSLNILLDNIEGTNLLLEYYADFSKKIFNAPDFKSIILVLHQELHRIYVRQRIEYILWQNNQKLLKFTFNAQDAKVNAPEEIHTPNTLYRYTLENPQIILTNSFKQFCDSLGVNYDNSQASCWLGIPMLVKGKVLGLVVVWDESPEHYFRLQDKQFISIITQITAFALENVYLYDYISEKEGTSQNANPFASAQLPTLSSEDVVNQLLQLLLQLPEVVYSGVFLRSQSHDKWRLMGQQLKMDQTIDPGADLLKNLIYLPEGSFQTNEFQFYCQPDPANVFHSAIYEVVKNYRTGSALVLPWAIQQYYYGVLILLYRQREEAPGPDELRILRFYTLLIFELIEKKLLLEHKKSYETYIEHLEKMKMVGELASGSAHHLNNILSVITGRAQILQKKMNNSPYHKDLEMISQAAEDGARAVRRLQSVKSKTYPLQKFESLNINDLILEVIEIARPRFEREAQSRSLTYDVKLTLGAASFVKGDAAALREVFLNLTNNALDSMPQGGKLLIKTTAEKGKVYIFFSDTGAGISEDLREKIFEPFFSTKGDKGHGLGLSIAAEIIIQHQGRIYVDSIPQKGSIFMVELPAVIDKPLQNSTRITLDDSMDYKILLVDDEKTVGETLAEMLKEEGCEVQLRSNPLEAAQIIEKWPFDILLTDLSMPGLNGLELAKRVKAIKKEIPVILITGWDQQHKDVLKANGFIDGYIEKPFNIKQIRDEFKRVMKQIKKLPGNF
jgi:signal transduction histidine kinase/ActR/RegA family two-component response regulator